MNPCLRLVFFGTPDFALPSLEALLAGPHEVLAVVTRPARPRGRGQAVTVSPTAALAGREGVEVIAPEDPSDANFQESITELRPDLGVVVAYGRILPVSLLKRLPLGFINAHASLLPRLRGAAPVERAILSGLETTGVTIMRLDEGMDTGPVMSAREHPITSGTDSGRLFGELSHLSADLLTDAVSRLATGEATFAAQDEKAATYAAPIAKEEARIDWTGDAAAAERQILAFSPAPGAFSFDKGRRLVLLEARAMAGTSGEKPGEAGTDPDGKLRVACGKGQLLVARVKPAGGRAMSAADYVRGRRDSGPLLFDDQN